MVREVDAVGRSTAPTDQGVSLLNLKHVHPSIQKLFPQPISVHKRTLAESTRFYTQNWATLTGDKIIRQMIAGWIIPIAQVPPQVRYLREILFSESEQSALSVEIQDMLQRGVIVPCEQEAEQYVSSLFPRPKSDGSVRPIINLRSLNWYIPYQKFKMESLHQVHSLIQQGDILMKVDIKNAYWSIPIHPQSQRYLKFLWKGRLYKFKVLPFGLGPAARVFSKIMKIPISLLRRLAVRQVVYLDDLLIMVRPEEFLRTRYTLIFILESLGLPINFIKSILTASHRCEFLGMLVDALDMTILLPLEKARKIKMKCANTIKLKAISPRHLSSLIGKLFATSPAIPHAAIQIRYLQMDLTRGLQTQSWDGKVSLSDRAKEEINWWIENIDLVEGNPISLGPPDIHIRSDASSKKAWGAHVIGGPRTGCQWYPV